MTGRWEWGRPDMHLAEGRNFCVMEQEQGLQLWTTHVSMSGCLWVLPQWLGYSGIANEKTPPIKTINDHLTHGRIFPIKTMNGHLKHGRIFPPWKGITFGKSTDSNLVQPLSGERQSCLLQAGDCELYVELLSHTYLPDALRVSGVVRRVPRTGEGSRETWNDSSTGATSFWESRRETCGWHLQERTWHFPRCGIQNDIKFYTGNHKMGRDLAGLDSHSLTGTSRYRSQSGCRRIKYIRLASWTLNWLRMRHMCV